MSYLSLEDSKGKDKFNIQRFVLFKVCCCCYSGCCCVVVQIVVVVVVDGDVMMEVVRVVRVTGSDCGNHV